MKKLFLGALFVFTIGFASISFASDYKINWGEFNEESWALYDLPGGMQQKQTLIAKSSEEVTIKYDTIYSGKVMSSNEMKISLNPQPTNSSVEQVDVKESTGDFSVKGENLACKIYEIGSGAGSSKTWFSHQVPGGLVQSEYNGTVSMKLLDYESK
jgi:hypothetical protein